MSLKDYIDNIDTVQPATDSYEPIPKGIYKMIFTSAEIADTKRGGGKVLKATASIADGEFEGRLIFTNFNIQNPNPIAHEIGRGQLSSAGKAMGLPVSLGGSYIPNDENQLLDRPFYAKVDIAGASAQYAARNEIKAYFSEPPKGKVAEPKKVVTSAKGDLEDLPDFLK